MTMTITVETGHHEAVVQSFNPKTGTHLGSPMKIEKGMRITVYPYADLGYKITEVTDTDD